MKKIVIIGANEFQNPLILKAKDLGYETHVFAWECGDIGEETADYFYPISIVEKGKILEVCKKIKPDAVVSIGSDLAVHTVTFVANNLELCSNRFEDSLSTTNKYFMRQKLKEAGIKVPNFERISSIGELVDVNFPKIIKPTDRSGSRAIALANNWEELQSAVSNAIESSFEKCAIVEDVINGVSEYSCEAISFNRKHRVLAVTKKYTTGFPKCIETGHIQPANISPEEMSRLEEIIPKALDSLNVINGPSHTEFILDENGEINIVEIGARMGGDCIGSHLVELSTGFDFLKMTLDVGLGQEPNFSQKSHFKYSLIKFVFNKDDLLRVEKAIEIFPDILQEKSLVGDMDHEVIDSSSRFGYFIFAFDSKEILEYMIREVMRND